MSGSYVATDGWEPMPWLLSPARERWEAERAYGVLSEADCWRSVIDVARERSSDPFLDQTDPSIIDLKLRAAIARKLLQEVVAQLRASTQCVPWPLLPGVTVLACAWPPIAPTHPPWVVHPTRVPARAVQPCAPPVPAADVTPWGHVAAAAA